MHTSRRRDKN